MSTYNIERFVDDLEDYLKYSYNRETLFELMQKLQLKIDENKDLNKDLIVSSAYANFEKLIDLFERYTAEPLILILKNANQEFDMYIFRNGLNVCLNDIVSSETFMSKLRETPEDGMIIDNIKPEEVFNFLKAYYLYRKYPVQDPEALNQTYIYSKDSLELTSILEEFGDGAENVSINKKNAIIYDNDALPYSLEYLDIYKKFLHTGEVEFADILRDVRENKYLGTSLKKVCGWWS